MVDIVKALKAKWFIQTLELLHYLNRTCLKM